MLAKGFLSVCASSSPSECHFSSGQGTVTYKRGTLFPRPISILMTLKSWDKKDEGDSDKKNLMKIQTNFHVIMVSSSFFQISKYLW